MAESPATEPPDGREVVERLQSALADWRARIDELLVQLDLAGMDLRDELAKQLRKAENTGLAVRSGIAYARDDLAAAASAQKDSITEALHDIQRALQSAREVLEGK